MATFLDITLMSSMKVIFIFLLVYVVVWGLLSWIRPFGQGVPTGPYAIIGLVAAFLSVISGTVRYLIEYVTPWFLFLVIFLFFLLFIIRMFNVSEENLFGIISTPSVYIMIIVIVVVIMLFGLGSAFGQKSLEATQGASGGKVQYYPPGYNTGDPEIGEAGSGSGGVLQPVGQVAPLEPGADLNNPGMYGGQPQPGQPGATATSSFSLNLVNTLFHPKVMAIIAMLLIGTVTVWLMARPDFV